MEGKNKNKLYRLILTLSFLNFFVCLYYKEKKYNKNTNFSSLYENISWDIFLLPLFQQIVKLFIFFLHFIMSNYINSF